MSETTALLGPEKTTQIPAGLFALALGGFGIGLNEFVVAGLLPDIAGQLHITEAASGWIISAYALAVAVGAFVVTVATARMPRKRVLLLLVVLFILGNAVCAVAPSYALLLVGRIVAALCHGAFFGTGAVVATSLVSPGRKARAIGLMFTGLTVANVLGVPAGTLVGEHCGWRTTFAAITGIGVLVLAGIAFLVPADAGGAQPLQLAAEARALRASQVWLSLAVTVFGFGGMFGAFSLISYPLTGLSGYENSALPWLLVLFGAGLVIGNIAGGRAADRSRDPSILIGLIALTTVMTIFAATATHPVLAAILLLLMGVFGFAITPGIQARVLDHAPGRPPWPPARTSPPSTSATPSPPGSVPPLSATATPRPSSSVPSWQRSQQGSSSRPARSGVSGRSEEQGHPMQPVAVREPRHSSTVRWSATPNR